MSELHEELAQRVADWRLAGYPCEYPAIGEIFEYAIENEEFGQPFPASGSLRYLRAPQLRALETYWYLRLVERTPHVKDLYQRMFSSAKARREALGLTSAEMTEMIADEGGLVVVIDRIVTDDAFSKAHQLEALHETLSLTYPSWILALAMGAGKTVLIGAIVATEFAMAIEYPDPGDDGVQFVENALVFAPGKTIIESLRELARIPYERLLPPRLYKPFNALLKLTFTRDGEKDIPVIRGSSFNLIVTNTEKIRIQARASRRRNLGGFQLAALEDQAKEEANLRLQAIASLPHLAIFSDEAHHTYGQDLGKELKRVRQTVDYLAENSPNLIVVVNTTGTPYYQRQPLRDVVVWYGLSQGIEDGILKELRGGNIQAFDVGASQVEEFVGHVVRDFFADYHDVQLPDGAPAKLAIYFPQTDDLDELRRVVDLTLADIGVPLSTVLVHTSKTGKEAEDAFNRLNDPTAEHRVILLVNKGTEGWNCPSLFATALARRLTSSNNFVLQAASRCLRQVPGNNRPARIYLSADNRPILERQLEETYGETLGDLDRAARATRHARIRLDPAKSDIPPMVLRRTRKVLRALPAAPDGIAFARPSVDAVAELRGSVLELGPQAATKRVLRAVGDAIVIEAPVETVDLYAAAVTLSANAHVPPAPILRALRAAYGPETVEIPLVHLPELGRQLDASRGGYETSEIVEDVALRIVKREGFDRTIQPDGSETFEAEISYPEDRAALVFGPERVIRENPAGYGFHYQPYNFDSKPEVAYFDRLLALLNERPSKVVDVYFIGALTSPDKTDLVFDYEREDGRLSHYSPDFLLRCNDDRWFLVEIKRERARADPIEGQHGVKARAIEAIVEQNRDRLDYRMVFTSSDDVVAADLVDARSFMHACAGDEGAG
jgi:type III restriction enzyme